MSARCEPPEELWNKDGFHWVEAPDVKLRIWRWVCRDGATTRGWPMSAAGYRYLAPVATHAEVEKLRAEVERLREALSPFVAVIPDICNALDLDPDETSIRVRVDGGARDGEVLAERTLTDMLTVARAALTHKEPGNEG